MVYRHLADPHKRAVVPVSVRPKCTLATLVSWRITFSCLGLPGCRSASKPGTNMHVTRDKIEL